MATIGQIDRLAARIFSAPLVVETMLPAMTDLEAAGRALGDRAAAATLLLEAPAEVERIAAALLDSLSDDERAACVGAPVHMQRMGATMLAHQVAAACSWLGVDPDDLDGMTLAVVLASRPWALDGTTT